MAFNPVDFYDFAASVYAAGSAAEAESRTIVSRAYYGAFLLARENARIPVATTAVHEVTARHYRDRHQAAIANRLDDLRVRRNDADYQLGKGCGRREAGGALHLSRRIIDDLAAL